MTRTPKPSANATPERAATGRLYTVIAQTPNRSRLRYRLTDVPLDDIRDADRRASEAAKRARRALAPLAARGRQFDHPGPGRSEGRDALMRQLELGLESGALPGLKRGTLLSALTQDAVADYLEPMVGLGVVVAIEDEDAEGRALLHPRTGRADVRVTWKTDGGKESKAWVSALCKTLRARVKPRS